VIQCVHDCTPARRKKMVMKIEKCQRASRGEIPRWPINDPSFLYIFFFNSSINIYNPCRFYFHIEERLTDWLYIYIYIYLFINYIINWKTRSLVVVSTFQLVSNCAFMRVGTGTRNQTYRLIHIYKRIKTKLLSSRVTIFYFFLHWI
jgi:hypothetical protein